MSEFDEFFRDMGVPNSPQRIVMLSAFEGWNDAGQAATQALLYLIDLYSDSAHEVGHIACASFYDYTVTRPVMVNVEGKRKIMWPETTFTQIDINPTLSLLIEVGPEPNFKWTDFARRSLRIAEDREVTEIITLGSMFADCTHTRPLPMYVNETTHNLADDNSYTGPIGIPSVVNYTAVENGYTTHSMWVSLPSYTQYVDSQDNPVAMLRILDELSTYLGVELKRGNLPTRALKWKAQADMLLTLNPEVKDYISRMENFYDNSQRAQNLSPDAADNLILETERFLREHSSGDDTSDSPEKTRGEHNE
ncbi:PAC2 family protein [Alloscardovia venturai]|uniref:PAC2 family protein n=1 Tax=Alloscardovia venturai TaxID=1769421 RepID=A0ABW2Y8S7_9BIFI